MSFSLTISGDVNTVEHDLTETEGAFVEDAKALVEKYAEHIHSAIFSGSQGAVDVKQANAADAVAADEVTSVEGEPEPAPEAPAEPVAEVLGTEPAPAPVEAPVAEAPAEPASTEPSVAPAESDTPS